jgi:hypothetical protein
VRNETSQNEEDDKESHIKKEEVEIEGIFVFRLLYK